LLPRRGERRLDQQAFLYELFLRSDFVAQEAERTRLGRDGILVDRALLFGAHALAERVAMVEFARLVAMRFLRRPATLAPV